MNNNNERNVSSTNISTTSISTDAISENNFSKNNNQKFSKNNNQKANTKWLTDYQNFLEYQKQLTYIAQELQNVNITDIENNDKSVKDLYDKVFKALNSDFEGSEYKRYQNEKAEKNKSWWQSVKDAFNRGNAEGEYGIKGFFKGCWEATKTGWRKAPTWAKVGIGAGLILSSALCMPMSTYTSVLRGSDILTGTLTGTSFSLKSIPWLLSRPSSWILPQNILPLTMICGGATILGMSGKKYVDKIRTERNMTDEEKQWYQTVHDKDNKAIEKKRAFLLFLISMLKNHDKYLFQGTGECLDAIQIAEKKETKKELQNNKNTNISQSQSQTIEHSNNKIKLNENNIVAEKRNENNVNNSKTNNKVKKAYNEENKEINNDNKVGKDDINTAITKNNIINNNII